MTATLPPETIDHIIDFLWDDQSTLAACASTSWSWLPASRMHIYAHPIIRSEQALLGFFEATDTLAIAEVARKASCLFLSHIEELHHLQVLASKCPYVESLACHNVDFSRNSDCVAVTMCIMAQFTKIRSLVLDHSRFQDERQLSRLLCSLPTLTRLICGSLHVERVLGSPSSPPSKAQPPALEALQLQVDIVSMLLFLSTLIHGSILKGVYELRLTAVDDQAEQIAQVDPRRCMSDEQKTMLACMMIQRASHSLRELHMTGINLGCEWCDANDRVKDCRSLRHLHLTFETWNRFSPGFLEFIAANSGSIEDLNIRQTIDGSIGQDWSAWSSALQQQQYAQLKRLSLVFTVIAEDVDRQAAKERLKGTAGRKTMQEVLGELHERGVEVELDVRWQAPRGLVMGPTLDYLGRA